MPPNENRRPGANRAAAKAITNEPIKNSDHAGDAQATGARWVARRFAIRLSVAGVLAAAAGLGDST
jgi:hypothetical protein